jgi:hypothetical protein
MNVMPLQSSDFVPMFINVLPSVSIHSLQTEDWNKALASRKYVKEFASCNFYASSGGKVKCYAIDKK